MWLRILKTVAQVAIAAGLDKVVKDWVRSKLVKVEKKLEDKVDEVYKEIDKMEGPDEVPTPYDPEIDK